MCLDGSCGKKTKTNNRKELYEILAIIILFVVCLVPLFM